MTDEKKKQLFPIFAYLYSKQLNPQKYGEAPKGGLDETDFKNWTEVIQQNPEDMDAITQAATKLSDEEWDSLETQVSQQTPSAKSGAKLNKLKKLQSLKKGAAPKKCGCGCNLIDYKEAGGKMSSKCACKCGGGSMKKEEGGSLPLSNKREDVILNAPDKLRQLYLKMKNQKIK